MEPARVNKINWIGWHKLTRSKNLGGLGFRDLHAFNLAMLARQGWRLLTQPDSLCAKYFPTGKLLEATVKGGISYTWWSILRGMGLLKEGIIWRIRDRNQVKKWSDPWTPRSGTRKVFFSKACLRTCFIKWNKEDLQIQDSYGEELYLSRRANITQIATTWQSRKAVLTKKRMAQGRRL